MICENFMAKIDEFVEGNIRALIDDLGTVVAIPSVKGEPAPGAPFGIENRQVLLKALEIAQRLGLETKNCEDYLGYAEIKGESDKYLATISHLDVVPEGNGWTGKPFEMREREGYLIGRGVADNKGPSIVSLYVAKFFKEQGKPLPYGLRIILGIDEERGMNDVKYYIKNYPAPVFAFSPDAEFPVCNGEKGVMSADFVSKKFENGNIVEFSGGVASNVVPDKAFAVIKTDKKDLAATSGIALTYAQGTVRIDAQGKGGHAAMPAGTINAIGLIVNFILDNKLEAADERAYLEYLRDLFSVNNGAGIGIDSDDGLFDPLTCIGGIIKFEDGKLRQNINVRFPTNTNGDKMKGIIEARLAPMGAVVENFGADEPFYISPDSEPIQICINTFNEVTGRNEKPFLMGGGTYARRFPHAVSFGIEFKDEVFPDFIGSVHGRDEGVAINTLKESLKIFIIAISRLMEVKF